MDYHLVVKECVDTVLVYHKRDTDIAYLGRAHASEDYETLILSNGDKKIFNAKIPKPEYEPVNIIFNLLGYGRAGGFTEYNLNSLVSVTLNAQNITANSNRILSTPIIINTPRVMRDVLLEFPMDLQRSLNLPSELKAMSFDTSLLKNTTGGRARELLARGVDPKAKNWVANLSIELPDWARDDPEEFQNYIEHKTKPVIVHCFSLSLQHNIEISALS